MSSYFETARTVPPQHERIIKNSYSKNWLTELRLSVRPEERSSLERSVSKETDSRQNNTHTTPKQAVESKIEHIKKHHNKTCLILFSESVPWYTYIIL